MHQNMVLAPTKEGLEKDKHLIRDSKAFLL
jgi:hypothetical protein